MSETKFTKGEWTKRDDTIGIIDDSDTQSYGMIRFICHVDKYDFESEWQANAHLIATAPDMYKNIEKDVQKLRAKVACYVLGSPELDSILLDLEEKENLLAQARGEQQ